MAFLIVCEIFMLWFSLHLLSGVRGAIQVEGIWSKAQKNAVNTLQQYAQSADTSNYAYFNEYLKVHEHDKIALTELKKPEPSRQIMLDNIVEAGVHPRDAKPLVDVFYHLNFLTSIEKALGIFWKSDERIMVLKDIGDEMHAKITENGKLTPEEKRIFYERINTLNAKFKSSEGSFITTISTAGRWIDSMVFRILITIALIVQFTGIIMAVSINKGIAKGINEVIRVSQRVGKGDYDERAKVYSKDEIGVLAKSFNEMIDEVKTTNQELNQFVYIASHDLQEPLNTIGSIITHLLDPNTTWEEGQKIKVKKFIGNATVRMQNLIKDLMDFSRIGHHEKFENVDMQNLMQDVVDQLQGAIEQSKAKISFQQLPQIIGSEDQLNRLFQNLISNAIKFQNKGQLPEIEIRYQDLPNFNYFIVKDNGIGIRKEQHERIFEVFQRLNNSKEYPGTGIGLAICKKIVHLHKGQIKVVSELNKGTEFHISIPKNLSN
jgi:signal transduction histidine kinase